MSRWLNMTVRMSRKSIRRLAETVSKQGCPSQPGHRIINANTGRYDMYNTILRHIRPPLKKLNCSGFNNVIFY